MKATTSLFLALFFATLGFAQSNFDSTFTQYFRRTNGWTAGDATISIPISPDSVLWLFGDSYNGNYAQQNALPCLFNARNAVVLQRKSDPNQLQTLQNPNSPNKTFFRGNEIGNDTFFWPGHGYRYLDTVYIFLNRYHTSSGTLVHMGTHLAKMSPINLQVFSIQPLHATNDIIFGRWVFIPTNNDYAFIYGNKKFTVQYNGQPLEIWRPFLARTNKNNPLAPWKYKTNTGWHNSPSQASQISDYGVSPGFSVIRRDNILYLVTQQNGYMQCGAGKEIYLLRGGVAHGDKFTQKRLVYTINTQFEGDQLSTYNAFSHPEWNHYLSGLLVSYNVNDPGDPEVFSGCAFQCYYGNTRNADTYRPKFIRIPWDVITTGWAENRSDAGLDALENSDIDLQLFPNPATDQLSVSIAEIPTERFIINVLDLSGRLIKTLAFEPEDAAQVISIDVKSLPKGLYILALETNSQRIQQKFIVGQ